MHRPEGWIYEKEAILEYILHKKIENAKMLKMFEKQKDNQEKEKHELSEIATKEKLEKFLRAEGKLVVSDSTKSSSSSTSSATTSKASDDSTSTKSGMFTWPSEPSTFDASITSTSPFKCQT